MGVLRAIDLFAGIGGIRLGFEQAFGDDIETVFVSDIDRYARKTYAANFDTPIDTDGNVAIASDIRDVDASNIPDFDICLAGFPCQAFSMAGKRMGFDDNYKGRARGTLFFEVARIIDAKKPRLVFCENVKGLLSHDKGRTFEIIKGTLEQLGYTVFNKVLNSCDFGVPQNRERIYIVALRDDISPSEFRFPESSHLPLKLSDVIETNPVPERYYISEQYLDFLIEHRKRNEAKGNNFGYIIREPDGIAGAVVCGGMGRERNLVIDDRTVIDDSVTNSAGNKLNKRGIRRLTPRECARLQGFPDTFRFVVSDTQLYKQFGNSVTVPVIKAIAGAIREQVPALQ